MDSRIQSAHIRESSRKMRNLFYFRTENRRKLLIVEPLPEGVLCLKCPTGGGERRVEVCGRYSRAGGGGKRVCSNRFS